MMKTVRWLLLAWLALFAAGVAFDVWLRRGAAPVGAAASASARENPNIERSLWTGSVSCGGRSCHGGIEPRPDGNSRQDEFTTFITKDPHARAYETLKNPLSQDMIRKLGRADGNAHEEARCLACHATPLVADPASRPMKASEAFFGVGCESCHGPAASWINEHYAKPKPRTSIVAVGDAATRARICAQCHVGSGSSEFAGDRGVDHDLIAAGHPRLLFEFVSLQEAMPAHWRDKPRDATHEWFIGQIAGARAALDVLKQRAATSAAPWPEFAEYDCFACHHDLKEKSWRQGLSFDSKIKRRAGTLPWNSWTFAVVVRLLELHNLPTDDWRQLRASMETFAAHDREKTREFVARVEVSLNRLAEDKYASQWKGRTAGAAKMVEFLKLPSWSSADSWEAAEQYFFALRTLRATADDPELARRLDELDDRRGFDAGFASPRRFDPVEFFNGLQAR
jgi:hypothetical protein